jgi:lipoprotein-anchoring transpeptidase ErfK/SrfK
MSDADARSALDHAWFLVRRGEADDALFWAGEAASLDERLEEAWLILAALSDPHLSFEYLRRALEINPRSRRGKHGVAWAEAKTGRLFQDFLSGFLKQPETDEAPAIIEIQNEYDFTALNNFLESELPDEPYVEEIVSTTYEPFFTNPDPQPLQPEPTIIRKRIPKRIPRVEPVNPWSVLLPYTISFVIFFFSASLWLLSGLSNVRAQSLDPTLSTDELVSQILTADPFYTQTPVPMATQTPIPSSTPTAIPTITFTPTPEPTQIPIEPSPIPEDDVSSPGIPIQIGDIIAETLEDGRWIEVDIDNQMVRAYEWDELQQEFLVSTGTDAHPTVKGNFHIYIKNRYADMRGPGYYLTNVPYTMYYYQSYGLHGTYWHSNFGTPMSHGCVNLRTEDAAWLFKWASLGTLVHVH